MLSYQKSLVVLPLLCPSWALALYVAHHDGKALAGPPSLFASAFLSVGFCSCDFLTNTSNSFGPAHRDDCPAWLLGQQGSTHTRSELKCLLYH